MSKKIVFFITLIPVIGCFAVINRVEPYVIGLPFNLFWCTMWSGLTALFLGIAYKIEKKDNDEDEENGKGV